MEKDNVKYPLRLLPDWELKNGISLVWPGGIDKYYQGINILPVYKDIVSKIPAIKELMIFSRHPVPDNEIGKINSNFRIIHNPDIHDIWIRDFAPMNAVDKTGRDVLVKFIYNPSYLHKDESLSSDNIGRSIAGILSKPMFNIPIVLDGGNMTHNGNGWAIMTSRVLHDNPGYSKNEIMSLFKEKLGINNLIIIEEDPEDPTGHIDGNVRFISPTTIAVNSFHIIMKKENFYLSRIVKTIKEQSNDKFNIIKIPGAILIDEVIDHIPSIFGNHINFLRTGECLFMPVYGIPSDIKALELFNKYLPDVKIIPVEAGPLSHFGGALNCFSWTY